MKVVAFVPIKLNNQRTPGKNTRELSDGTPICQLIFNTVSAVDSIDEAYCFCSQDSIQQYLSGRVKYLKRDVTLDSQQTSGNQLVGGFLEKIDADIIVMAHVTAPFLKPETISKCIDAVKSGEYDSATTITSLREFLWNDNGPMNYDPANIPRTQDLEHVFRETTGLYVFRKDVFTEHNRRLGFKPFFCEVGTIEGLDIDYPEDFDIVDAVYSKFKGNL